MPKYKNTNATVVVIGPNRMEPGDTITTNNFLLSLPSGVTLISALPVFNPVLVSEKITHAQTITVPIADNDGNPLLGGYRINIYAASGDITVKLNDTSVVACIIPEGLSKEWQCLSRTISTIIIAMSSGDSAYLTIEQR